MTSKLGRNVCKEIRGDAWLEVGDEVRHEVRHEVVNEFGDETWYEVGNQARNYIKALTGIWA